MELGVMGAKFIFTIGFLFFAIQSVLIMLIFWRFSLVKFFPFFVCVAFVALSMAITGHAILIFSRL